MKKIALSIFAIALLTGATVFAGAGSKKVSSNCKCENCTCDNCTCGSSGQCTCSHGNSCTTKK